MNHRGYSILHPPNFSSALPCTPVSFRSPCWGAPPLSPSPAPLHSPWDWLELAAATLNRVVPTRWLATFFWGWKSMMWSLGVKRQPRTTVPLRLTEMHMVVVWTWRQGWGGQVLLPPALCPEQGRMKPLLWHWPAPTQLGLLPAPHRHIPPHTRSLWQGGPVQDPRAEDGRSPDGDTLQRGCTLSLVNTPHPHAFSQGWVQVLYRSP